ncbi:Uncharacterized protein TCM_023665 [Theobroma cacao]|uniref:Uncharacterized protein n=1 Tax=Theobroma cacao TaxID=3641 RepID=A0A061F2G3_THECC|nr:Uncharacterized protein TCM_023665 [Theobroma cacao]
MTDATERNLLDTKINPLLNDLYHTLRWPIYLHIVYKWVSTRLLRCVIILKVSNIEHMVILNVTNIITQHEAYFQSQSDTLLNVSIENLLEAFIVHPSKNVSIHKGMYRYIFSCKQFSAFQTPKIQA